MPHLASRTARLALVLALVASMQGLLFVQMAWQVNQEWIAETLCVNRARPELHCEGSCQLKERLAAQQKQDDESRTVLLGVALSVTAHVAERPGIPAPEVQAEVPHRARPSAGADTGVDAAQGVFHPPREA